ncbi:MULTISPECIES: ATP-binding cassette domain-containing protein [unclassified Methylosinus]|uniref:ATP-binding cassette domain-containing protein n=1 Tax=unclassified Methylosinus TaxID=2624500 RepID=UPI0004B76F96|nr:MULTISPECIES: ATP-binding cassette domain-containing protein [unclassified Methylosinus]
MTSRIFAVADPWNHARARHLSDVTRRRGAVMIRLEHVSKCFGGARVVDDVTLTIEPARTTALIGPSGSGKSTLLAMIVGLVTPDEGEIEVARHLLTPLSAAKLRSLMGYVIQEGGLFPHLTARRNIELMAREMRWPAERRTARLEELLRLTRFPAEALDRFPAELSGGQRQRVALMRALMLDPEILLMDEPLGALDPLIRADLQDDLAAIFARLRKTVVIVTHDLAEAGFFAEQIVLMNHGRIVQQGRFADFVERPAEEFVTRFVRASARRLADLPLPPEGAR